MVKRQTALKIRKAHRYLGIFIGIQFLMWTISGMYFSWTDIDEIHGDQFRKTEPVHSSFTGLLSPSEATQMEVKAVELKEIAGEPYYWINHSMLHNARTGEMKDGLTEAEALAVAKRNMRDDLEVSGIEKITTTGKHHEYRGGPLPAYVISYDTSENIKAYVSANDGSFRTLRHRDWRWFDFLWMTHTMDYEGRDDFNTLLLRSFSLLGLITVFSGFLLWFTSSPTVIKLTGNKKKKKKKRSKAKKF
ncbi:PepSY domain-containing protein [Salinimicrobium soli]|uniref:PepSY domain-containing protein n=1 Tax=Salinimicrobium soli TaxID=1254399 RepID=UPI003AAEF9DF